MLRNNLLDTLNSVELFEHKIYKNIPGTRNSYREDSGNTNTITQKHAHVYAKMEGKGEQLYSVNINGSGHDGSSGKQMPKSHGDFFRNKGYDIPADNIIRIICITKLDPKKFRLEILHGEIHNKSLKRTINSWFLLLRRLF